MIGTRASLTAFALALVVSGCSFIAKKVIEKPKVDLASVNLRDAHATGATVVFGVKVENPNSFALRVDSLKYDVEIGGKAFSSGKLEKPAEVGGKGTAVIDVPVPVRYADVFASLLEFVQKGTSSYRVKGTAAFGVLEIPFDEKGDLKFTE